MSWNKKDFWNEGSQQVNVSHVLHGGVALLISVLAVLLGKLVNPIHVLCFSGALFFFSWELVQKIMLIAKNMNISPISWDCISRALQIWNWDLDSTLDWIVPLAISIILTFFI